MVCPEKVLVTDSETIIQKVLRSKQYKTIHINNFITSINLSNKQGPMVTFVFILTYSTI